jgi:hypothetical protein
MEAKRYIETYNKIRQSVDSDEVAVAIMQEIGKDARVKAMHENGNGAVSRSNGFDAATAKQLAYLQSLGVSVSAGCTRQEASDLIDNAIARAAV